MTKAPIINVPIIDTEGYSDYLRKAMEVANQVIVDPSEIDRKIEKILRARESVGSCLVVVDSFCLEPKKTKEVEVKA